MSSKYRCDECEDWGTALDNGPCPNSECPIAAERARIKAAAEPAPAATPGVLYPLPSPEGSAGDPRWTAEFVLDVAAVLAKHGFPPIKSGGDYVELQQALWRFLYVPYEFRTPGPVAAPADTARMAV